MNLSNSRLTLIAIVLLQSLLAFSAFGQKLQTAENRSRVIEAKLFSVALQGNLLGDPVEQNVAVYLPPTYAASPRKRYPVIYLLHGYGGDSRTWISDGPFSVNAPLILDSSIASGRIREMIVVAPNGSNAYHGSFYLNSEVTGRWEDYIFRDVVAYIDKNYRTLARAASRGIAGHSMGGFGAVSIGMKHADVFGTVYAMSPAPLGHEDDAGELTQLWSVLRSYKSRSQLKSGLDSPENLYSNLFVALSAALAPNPKNGPFFIDFAYDEHNGKLQRNPVVEARWKSNTPLYTIDQHKANLTGLRGLAIDYGTRDEFRSVLVNVPLFSKALADRGIPHTLEVYDGTHENKLKERLRENVFPFFSKKLEFQR